MNIVETIRKAIASHGLIPAGTKVVAAVSGGADSVAMLHAFHALGIPCTVAHLNHQLRGAESDADEEFVRQLCAELEYPYAGASVDVKQTAASCGLSTEMAARQARHAFFRKFGDATVALAHHADDQVETFMLKLARGAGVEGLAGMPFCQSLNGLRIIRPMLNIQHAKIVQWLQETGTEWREDASNRSEHFLRNRVRHTIIPLLERELNPNIRESILRTMDILREENAWTERMIGELTLDAQQPLAVKRRLLRRWLFDHGTKDAEYVAVDKILTLMDKGHGTTVFELNDRQRVVVEYGRPRFEEDGAGAETPAWKLVRENGTGWRCDPGEEIGRLPAEASFDADRVGDAPIEIRTYLPGDRMDPLGVEGSRKLQDIFTDRKVPRERRKKIPVVVCRGEIIWLPGYRISRGWAVHGRNGKSVHIRIEQNHGT